MQVYILITEKCNLNCSMCIRGEQSGIDLDYDAISLLPFVDELAEHDVVITGGEPTQHKDFCRFVKFFCKHAKTVTVTTNGTSRAFTDSLCSVNRKNLAFQLSLDGDKTAHDNIRGSGVFDEAVKTLRTLETLGWNYTIASVVSRKNVHAMKPLAELLETFTKMRYWRLSYEMPFGSAGFDDMMTAEEWNTFVDELLDFSHVRTKIQKIFPFDLYDKNIELLNTPEFSCRRCSNCGSGKRKIYIYPNLMVYPCTCLTDFPVGSVRDSTLNEILNSKALKPFSEYAVHEDSRCNNCKYKPFCNGGCIGMSYHYFGRLGVGDIRCPKLQ